MSIRKDVMVLSAVTVIMVLSLVVCLFAFTAIDCVEAKSTERITVDNLKYELDHNEMVASVVGYVGKPNMVDIPEKVDYNGIGYTVTSIGKNAFRECATLKNVSFPETLTVIGNHAFCCADLTELVLPESITELGAHAFSFNEKLKSITLPENLKKTGNLTFKKCGGIKSITIESPDVKLGAGSLDTSCNTGDEIVELTVPISIDVVVDSVSPAFSSCNHLKKVTFTPGNGEWFPYEFATKFNELKKTPWRSAGAFVLDTVVISDGITSIPDKLLRQCGKMKNVVIPESVTTIGKEAFRDCSSLKSITLPSGLTSLGKSAFEGCKNLIDINLPEKINTIEDYTFKNCKSLKSVNIPCSVQSLGKSAFKDCTGLKELIVPSSLNTVGGKNQKPFEKCKNIETVTLTDGYGKAFDYAADEKQDDYYGYTPWHISSKSLKKVIISEDVRSIGNNTFRKCSFEYLEMADTVETIGDYAFADLKKIKTIQFGDGLNHIGKGAFKGIAFFDSEGTSLNPDVAQELRGNRFEGNKTKMMEISAEKQLINVLKRYINY